MMQFKRIVFVLVVMVFLSGTLTAQAAAPAKSTALEPWTSEVVDKIPGDWVGAYVSIDHYERDGRAYVSYYDGKDQNLKITYQVDPGSGNCPGNLNWHCETVDNSENWVGKYSSIDVVDTSPTPEFHYAKIGISYYDETAQALKFAGRSCVSASDCEWIITTVVDDSSDDIGRYSSFEFENETTPVIFYQLSVSTVGHVWRAKAVVSPDGHGACTDKSWSCEQVAGSGLSSQFGSHISSDGGKVVFYDAVNKQLLLAHWDELSWNNSCGNNSYWICEVIDSTLDYGFGLFASFKYDGETAHVAYYDATNKKVKYAVSTPPNTGNGTDAGIFDCYAVDDVGSPSIVPLGISLSLDAQGQPIITYPYVTEATTSLMIARPASVYGATAGNCGDASHEWQCKVIDGGGSGLDEGRYADVSVNPVGLATVAYYENDSLNSEGRLKVAQQHFGIYLPLITK